MGKTHFVWPEKYRPTELDEFIGSEAIKAKINGFVESGDIPHLLFAGKPGTGKSTLAKILGTKLNADVLYINASDENNVETVRTKIKEFASTMGFSPLKVVILDEMDYMSQSAQAALRELMERYALTTRFILTCNYAERILEPIRSRTQQLVIDPPTKRDVALRMKHILDTESVTFDPFDLKQLISRHYPDIRKIINEAQLYSGTGTLVLDGEDSSDYKNKILEVLVSKKNNNKALTEIRQILADTKIKDYSSLYGFLFDKVDTYGSTSIPECILAIAEGQYKDALVVDKEINACATLVNILQTI